jgi:hypothetical protein
MLRFFLVLVCSLAVSTAMAANASAVTLYRGANAHDLQTWSVSDAQMVQELNALQATGANVIRVDLTWSALEPVAEGQYSSSYLARMDEFVADCQTRGLKIIMTIAATPSWASAGKAWNDAPTDPSTFGQVAQFVTSRYGSALAAVEAWNEPNWSNNLIAANGSTVPATYAAMLKAFYTGAKQGNPNVPVLAGATAYTDTTFLNALYANGIKGYFDGISVHPYADGADPASTTVYHSFVGQIQTLHAAQVAAGDNTPIWITEFGWPVGTFSGANTLQQQATYTNEAYSLINSYPYVEGATVYQLRDAASDPTNAQDGFGLLQSDFTPRPSYASFQAAMQADNATTTTSGTTTSGTTTTGTTSTGTTSTGTTSTGTTSTGTTSTGTTSTTGTTTTTTTTTTTKPKPPPKKRHLARASRSHHKKKHRRRHRHVRRH